MLFINLKTYPNGTGQIAKQFIIEAEKLYNEIQVPICFIVQTVDMWLITPSTHLPIWAQHVDNIEPGKNTGWVLGEALIEAGAKGVLLNHAEHKLPLADIRSIIRRYQSKDFQIMVSSRTPEETMELDLERPDYLSLEPSLYIGTGTSVLNVAPHLISNLSGKVKIPLIVGSGIQSTDLLEKGLKLGAKGFLISSAILLDPNPLEKLKEFMIAYKEVL